MKKFTMFLRVSLILAVLSTSQFAKAQCAASFVSSNQANGLVTFTSTSILNNSVSTVYHWNYGTGATFSATGSAGMFPSYQYTANGTYTVTLFIMSTAPTCSAFATGTVVVTNGGNGPCNLGASFTRTVGANGQVNFTNQSTGTVSATSYTWNFGDNTTSNLVNPSHTYTASGFYVVTLVADNNFTYACTGTVQMGHTITLVPTNTCVANANFSLVPTSTPQLWNALVAGSSSITSAIWSWGDGSTSNTLLTSHQYSAAGMYSICLTVTVNCGSTATFCGAYSIFKGQSGFINVNVLDAATVGLNEQTKLSDLVSVYPNPNNGQFNVQLADVQSGATIEIVNLFGQLILKSEVDTNNGDLIRSFDLSEIENGIYFVKVSQGNQTAINKISVQK